MNTHMNTHMNTETARPYGVVQAEQRAAEEAKLQAFFHAQILVDDNDPDGAQQLLDAVAAFGPDGMPPCAKCGRPIQDPRDAVVSKRSSDSPSRLLHGVCFGQELTRIIDVAQRRGGRALGLDVL